ncbi:Pyoverdine/dityrosine biosynthesis protein-domain-containing protein, partial [Tricladium varicosporioides]
RDTFRPLVLKFIRTEVPIRMVLPAFPFKSRNRGGKVLGKLPDLGEDIALARLQALCDDIKHIYSHGAELTISSDGIVYNDVLMISDEDTRAYGQVLREIGKKYPSLKFKKLADLLGHNPTSDQAVYLASAQVQREEFVTRFTPEGYDIKKSIKNDEDVRLTYLGYVKWLEKEMENVSELKLDENGNLISNQAIRRNIKALARKMITRGAAFTNIIKATHGDFIRLSIHQSIGINKFPIQLIPQAPDEVCRTPWHSAIAVSWDGSIKSGYAEDFPSESHELVYKDGRPYCLQEKSE